MSALTTYGACTACINVIGIAGWIQMGAVRSALCVLATAQDMQLLLGLTGWGHCKVDHRSTRHQLATPPTQPTKPHHPTTST